MYVQAAILLVVFFHPMFWTDLYFTVKVELAIFEFLRFMRYSSKGKTRTLVGSKIPPFLPARSIPRECSGLFLLFRRRDIFPVPFPPPQREIKLLRAKAQETPRIETEEGRAGRG